MNKKFARILLYKEGSVQRRLVVRQNQSAPITIGKEGFGAIIDIDERFISREHARIEVRNISELWVVDLDSTNGTFVNGERVSDVWLRDGDTISGGRTEILVRIQEDGGYAEMETAEHDQFDPALAMTMVPETLAM